MDSFGLKRVVRLSDGGVYAHRCERTVYEAVAYQYEDGHGHTLEEVARALDLPYTQVNVAMEFMKERGITVVKAKRRSYAASPFVYEDAMLEYLALVHEGT